MADYTSPREREYQNHIVDLFRDELHYHYLGSYEYPDGRPPRADGQTNGPIIEADVRRFLLAEGRTEMQITETLRQLRAMASLSNRRLGTLIDANTAIYEAFTHGFKAKPTPDDTEQDVMLFDFDHPERNHFALAEEVSYIDPITGQQSRPDLVVYVNGIALAVIELKRACVSCDDAVRQHLRNEEELIPTFFTTTQFTVAARPAHARELSAEEKITDGMYGFKYATVGTPPRFWCPWKQDTTRTGLVMSDEDSFRQFFHPATFLFLVRYGVLCDGGVKKVMRPHQYHALRAAQPRLQAKASGVIWHSQGSGKSLTMVWLAAYIKANFPNPRIVVITDRKELNAQLTSGFAAAQEKPYETKSGDDLRDVLNRDTEWLITTLIHKFGNHANNDDDEAATPDDVKIPLDDYLRQLRQTLPPGFKAKGDHIFVFVDECHRTQGGRLHEAMREIMGQEVMLIGFTGTPLLRKDKDKGFEAFQRLSEKRFGAFIHKYLHKQAVEDHVVLDLQYEAREVDQQIRNPQALDKRLETITAGLTEDRQELIKKRWATLRNVYSAKGRIERIGYSILDDVENPSSSLSHDWANAMLVAGSIYSAFKYYEFFQGQDALRGRVAVVTSYSATNYEAELRTNQIDATRQTREKYRHDMAERAYADAGLEGNYDPDRYEQWAKNLFTTRPARMKLLIVVDKLLTGFDAPSATYLYIDREMHDHTLFQAICRVNRLGTDIKDDDGQVIAITQKEYGLIVDFKHLFHKIEDAVCQFNDINGGFAGLDEEGIDGLLTDHIIKKRQRLVAADEAFTSLKATWESLHLDGPDALVDYYITDFEGDPASERRTQLYAICQAMANAYDQMADYINTPEANITPQEARTYKSHAREAAQVIQAVKTQSGDNFDPRQYDPQMQELLDRQLTADDAEQIVAPTADFSFLDLLHEQTDEQMTNEAIKAAGGSQKGAASIVGGKIRSVINNSRDRDPELARRLSERLQEILDKIRSQTANFAEAMQQMIQLLREAHSGGHHYPDAITTPLQKAYWNNREACGFATDDEQEATRQAMRASELVVQTARPNFREPGHAHALLFKSDIKKSFPNLNDEQREAIYRLAVQN